MADGYRARIYGNYVEGRGERLAPEHLEGLRSRAPYLEKVVRENFPRDRDAVILDLGCGHGALIHFARLAGYTNVTGVDVSPEQVEAAARLGIEGVRLGDVTATLSALAAGSLDVIVSFDVIEHFTKDELIAFADGVHRALKHGGRWIIHAPNAESPFYGRIRHGDLTHELAFTRISIAQLLKSSGFGTIECREDAPVVHGLKSGVRWLLWQGIRAGLRAYLAVETGSGARESILTQNFLVIARK